LGYIQQFPLDQIKIDRAFVQDLPDSAESLAIIEAISILSRGLGMDVIAEGVEQIEQAEILSRAGCQFGQGWLYGRPMPQDELIARLADELRLPKRIHA
ncbi:MAG: EAL domain-containing protein, partial [Cohaesibacteraceae bacterium]|nr:EAL domain-containing protein [Cohaesibacteraceae bacterium]